MSFLSPWYLNTWSYEGLVADSWSSAPPRYNKRAWRGPKVPFLYTFESLTLSLPSEKGHGKDCIRNILRLEDKPRALQWDCKDIKKTKRTNEDNPRTNPGQAEDRKRTCEGPHRQKVQPYQNIFIMCVVLKHSQKKNNKKIRAQITMTMCGLIGKLTETAKGC